MKRNYLEICVDSTESALEAIKGGADRLELCSNLMIGGTTPSVCLFQQVRNLSDVPIHILIRPRYGDFCYSEYEFKIIQEEVKLFHSLGADGVVIGILKEDGFLDKECMRVLIEEAKDMKITLHRAFDMCKDPFQTLEDAIELGVHLILTSGQKNQCVEGKSLIRDLVHRGGEKIRIMAGGGMSAQIAKEMYEVTGIRDFHMSGKVIQNSRMKYRKEGVSMGLSFFSEYEIWRTSKDNVSEMKDILNTLL